MRYVLAIVLAAVFLVGCGSEDAPPPKPVALASTHSLTLPADWELYDPAAGPWEFGEPPIPDATGADTYYDKTKQHVITVARRTMRGNDLRAWENDLQTTGSLDGCGAGGDEETTLGGQAALLHHSHCLSDDSYHQMWIAKHGKYGYAVLCGSLLDNKNVTDKKCRAWISTFEFN